MRLITPRLAIATLAFVFAACKPSPKAVAAGATEPEKAASSESAPAAPAIAKPASMVPTTVATTPALEERSAILIVRGFSGDATYFGGLLGPKVSSKASATGISVSPVEVKQATEKEMINEARSRGANYLVDVAVANFSSTSAEVFGQKQRRMAATLAWRIIDITGANVAVASGEAKDFNLSDTILPDTEQSSNLADSIATKAGVEIANALKGSTAKAPNEVATPIVIIADELSFPSIVVGKDYIVKRSKENLQVKLSGFTVVVDGIVVGTTDDGTPVNLPVGLHDISLERSGFSEWKQRVRVVPGLSLRPVIRPNPQSLVAWREQIQFLQDLAAGAKLTDAQVELVKGKAQELRNSGYRVDIKVDANELPETMVYPNHR